MWGQGLTQYTGGALPSWAGYTAGERGAPIEPYLTPRRAVLWLTTTQPAGFGTSWAAYHAAAGAEYNCPYAVCPVAVLDGRWPWLPPLAALTIPVSHELAEMLSDPTPGVGGWVRADGEENADICNWGEYPIVGQDGSTGYTLTRYASNETQGCYP